MDARRRPAQFNHAPDVGDTGVEPLQPRLERAARRAEFGHTPLVDWLFGEVSDIGPDIGTVLV